MKYRRDSITVHRKDIIDKIDRVGINITQGGEAELRVNDKVVARLMIRRHEEGLPEARPTGGSKRLDVSN